MSTFAITLKKLLQEKNMKQNELARLTKINKSSYQRIHYRENYQPKYKNILKIAEVLNVSPNISWKILLAKKILNDFLS